MDGGARDRMPDGPPTRVLLIAGVGRSGSTLLGRLLGEAPGFVHVGELYYVWSLGFGENHLCGCGAPFRDCSFWNIVFADAFGGMDAVDYDEILRTKALIERTRTLPRLFSPVKSPCVAERFAEYQRTLTSLYRAIARVSGARVVVDGSKVPPYAYVLPRVPGLDLRAVHLVRDSRAVAHSLRRTKANPIRPDVSRDLDRIESPASVALIWNAVNLLLLAVPPARRTIRLRYEDFVREPCHFLDRVMALVDEGPYPAEVAPGRAMEFGVNHSIAGNPDRFNSRIAIRPDIEWRDALPAGHRARMTLLTWPLMAAMGYRGDEDASAIAPRR
jgi:hypothetical protein